MLQPPGGSPGAPARRIRARDDDRGGALLRKAGCPKVNLQVRLTNEGVIALYRHLGYAVDEVVRLGKWFKHDEEGRA